ncbi:CoA-disulfide reductase [Spiroplasma taiwanense]|uniref:NADH oxidase n=1 Tax=Spiroplasma taiwanense CT-1 TaxID=1276220 RepID=S5MB23_9MOLU|nr:CoA-disulfide reductase [Spiroplasma taiwanense]AGR40973.1 NADH oxidase [Spiroplasma taiwanense CT-1]
MRTIIIGGSATGMGVAARLKRNLPDSEIIVFQEKKYVSLGACGLPYFVANNFTDENILIARTKDDFEKTGIKIYSNINVNTVDFENKKVFFNNQQLEYDNLVIAVGAKPIIPNIKGINGKSVFTLTTLEDGIMLKKKMEEDNKIKKIAVIGAGFIGLEMCETFRELNKEVYLIEMEKRISSKAFDEEFSDLILEKLNQKSINVLLNHQVSEILLNTNDEVNGILLKNGEKINVDAVLMAVGFKPNTEIFNNSKLAINSKGAIIVNTKGETNISSVYSAGDCTTSKNYLTDEDIYSPLATVASKFARVIADNISGRNENFVGSIQSAMIRIFDLEVARTGLSENDAKERNINFKSVLIKDKDHTAYTTNQKDLYLKIIMNNDSKEIIGAQMAGSNNSILRINALSALIWQKAKLDSVLEQIDFAYAPPFSKTTDIVHIAMSKLKK